MLGGQREQNVAFQDDDLTQKLSIPSRGIDMFGAPGLENGDLGSFLSRPLRIARSVDFAPLADRSAVNFPNGVLDPWSEYLNTTSVENKLRNFNLFRATLNLRVVVNGTKFNYGRAMLAYEPLYGNQDATYPTCHRLDPFTLTNEPGSPDGSFMLPSQLPHVLIDPSQNQSAIMQIPFVYPTEWLQIASSSGDYNVGGLKLIVMSPLSHVGDGIAGSVTVTIYAWFTDVQLSGLTTLTAQSSISELKAEADYEKDGAISGPASSVAMVASMLTSAPIIGPFAKATEIGAGAIASIAKIFGFSKPVLLDDPVAVKNMPFRRFAVTSTSVDVEKLSYDPKSELTVDGGAVGLDSNDDMTIHNVVGHPSLLTFFDWSTADPLSTSWSLPIDPGLFNSGEVSPAYPGILTQNASAYTALAFGSRPFEYWTGTLVYRIQVVCSDFHKGRLRIGYDPNPTAAPTINSSSLIYNRIVDISNEKEFTIEVPWTQGSRWQKINHVPITGILETNSTNGMLQIQVINSLIAPDTSDSSIRILVWVYAGKDFQLARPTVANIRKVHTTLLTDNAESLVMNTRSVQRLRANSTSELVAQSDVEQVESAKLEAQQQSLSPTCCDDPQVESLAPVEGEASGLNLVYMGERYVSFRTLLKRMTYWRTFLDNDTLSGKFDYYNLWVPHFPIQHGAGNTLLNPGDNFNLGGTCLMAYLIPAYATVRGSTRISFRSTSQELASHNATVYRTSWQDSIAESRLAIFKDPNITELSLMFDPIGNGGMIYDLNVQPGMEVESPFYQKYRFAVASSGSNGNYTPEGVGGLNVTVAETQGVALFVGTNGTALDDTTASIDVFYGAGEDFNLNWFLGCPFDLEYVPP